MKTISRVWSLLATCVLGMQAASAADDLYLVNANIVDPSTRTVQRGNLLIKDGRIVDRPREPPPGFEGKTLDLKGKWLIPGLVDLHTHTFGNVDPTGPTDTPWTAGIAQRMLYAGVTTFLDLFGDEDKLFDTREQQHTGKLGGADMFASLSCITSPGGHGTEYGVKARTANSPEEARQAVTDLSLRHPDVIKIVYELGSGKSSIDKPTLFAAVAAAQEKGLKTIVHVTSWQNVRDAIEAGATAITHVPHTPMPKDLAALMAAKKVASIPTLAVHMGELDFLYDKQVLDAPLARALTTQAVITAYRSPEFTASVKEFREIGEQRAAEIRRSVKKMADAGVPILAGSDSGALGTIHGYSAHRELVKLVEAGLTPWQALAAATTEAGAFLGQSYGVTPGSVANLVVLEASPLADIHNTQRIEYVIHHGTVVDREAVLTSELAGLRRSPKL